MFKEIFMIIVLSYFGICVFFFGIEVFFLVDFGFFLEWGLLNNLVEFGWFWKWKVLIMKKKIIKFFDRIRN